MLFKYVCFLISAYFDNKRLLIFRYTAKDKIQKINLLALLFVSLLKNYRSEVKRYEKCICLGPDSMFLCYYS